MVATAVKQPNLIALTALFLICVSSSKKANKGKATKFDIGSLYSLRRKTHDLMTWITPPSRNGRE